jgi:hypothetical protein
LFWLDCVGKRGINQVGSDLPESRISIKNVNCSKKARDREVERIEHVAAKIAGG